MRLMMYLYAKMRRKKVPSFTGHTQVHSMCVSILFHILHLDSYKGKSLNVVQAFKRSHLFPETPKNSFGTLYAFTLWSCEKEKRRGEKMQLLRG